MSGISKSLSGLGRSGLNLGKSLTAGLSQIGLAIVAVRAATAGLKNLLGGPIQLAAELETTTTSFTTLLGSASAAESTLKDLASFAASTPFQFPEITDAAKKLIAFGVSSEDLIPTLKNLGDVSSGLNIPFGELSEIYGKAKVQGRLFMEDINQLAGRGIPIQAQLAKQFGVTGEEVRALVSSGKVNFGHLEKAMQDMTGAGGQFAGLMEAQSGTLSGLWSTAKDNVNLVLTDIGKKIIDTFNLKDKLKSGIDFIQSIGPRISSGLDFAVAKMNEFKPFVLAYVNTLKAYWGFLFDVTKTIFKSIAGLFSGAGSFLPSFAQARDFILDGLILMEFGFKNWKEILGLAFDHVKLGVVSLAGDVKHGFQVVGSVLSWLGDNWKTILFDMFEVGTTVFINLTNNIVKILKNLPGLIKGSVSFGELWTPLTEGARTQLSTLPDIPEKVMSEFERNLRKDIEGSKQRLLEGYTAFRDQRFKELFPEVKKIQEEAKEILEPKIEDIAAQAKKGDGKSPLVEAQLRGSAEARQTILRHRFGMGANDPLSKIEKVNKDQLSEQKETNRLLKKPAQPETVSIPV